jgi:hypothetical protein
VEEAVEEISSGVEKRTGIAPVRFVAQTLFE